MQFLTVAQMAHLLKWRQRDVLAAYEQGILVGIRSPLNKKLALLDPGIRFLDFLRHPESRMPFVPLIAIPEIAKICGWHVRSVRRAMRQGKLRPAGVPPMRIKRMNCKYLFTPWEVRRFLLEVCHQPDPLHRESISIDQIVTWFHEISMRVPIYANRKGNVEEEIRWAVEQSEPERSRQFEALLEKIAVGREILDEERAAK